VRIVVEMRGRFLRGLEWDLRKIGSGKSVKVEIGRSLKILGYAKVVYG